MFTVMITDGGPHPADKWAYHVAQVLVPLGDVTIGDRPAQALRLQLAVVDAITAHFAQAQRDEQGKLNNDADRFQAAHDTETYAQPAVAAVMACAAGTPWAAHFNEPAVVAEVSRTITTHMLDALHIERCWHADRNPHLPQGQHYKALHVPALPVE